MTLRQIAGLFLVTLPFAVVFIGIVREEGIRVASAIFGGTLAIAAVIMLGSYMLLGTS